MHFRVFIWLGLFSVLLSCNSGVKTREVYLFDQKGQKTTLTGVPDHKATVLVFLSPECPLCQSYTLTINELIKKYEGRDIDFVGIIPTTDFSEETIKDYRITYKPMLPLLRDPENKLVKALGATITPEVFVLNRQYEVMYSGRIDNWAYELAKKRKLITAHDLQDALEAMLAGKKVIVTQTKAVGCFIE